MKRFDEWNHKKTESPNNNGEKKPGRKDKKSLDDTKKHLGFQWEIPNK
jgi:hypothetical protein